MKQKNRPKTIFGKGTKKPKSAKPAEVKKPKVVPPVPDPLQAFGVGGYDNRIPLDREFHKF